MHGGEQLDPSPGSHSGASPDAPSTEIGQLPGAAQTGCAGVLFVSGRVAGEFNSLCYATQRIGATSAPRGVRQYFPIGDTGHCFIQCLKRSSGVHLR